MIRVCHIVPASFHNYLATRGLCQVVMAMAPIACRSARYAELFRTAKAAGAYVILDNGTPYLGQSVPDDQLAAAAELVRPDVVVLPDVLNDRHATEARIDSFLTHWSRSVRTLYMGVVQGRTFSDYLESYRSVAGDSRISQIGVPFMKTRQRRGAPAFQRERLLESLASRELAVQTKPHHLLGLSHSGHIELRRLRRFPFVTSCDTSAAYKMAMLGRRIEPSGEYAKPRVAIDFDSPFALGTAVLTVQNAICIDACGC